MGDMYTPSGPQPLERVQVHYPYSRFRLVKNMGRYVVYDVRGDRFVDTTQWPQQLKNDIVTNWRELYTHDFTIIGGQVRVLD